MKRFGALFVRGFAVLLALGCLYWMVYAVLSHYRGRATSWDYFPFVAGGLLLMFALALLSKATTKGAADVIIPFVRELRLGRRASDPVLTPVATDDAPTTATEGPAEIRATLERVATEREADRIRRGGRHDG